MADDDCPLPGSTPARFRARPAGRHLAPVPARPRPPRAAARRGAARGARPLPGRVRRPAPARRGARPPPPDAPPRGPGPAEPEWRDAADRPARPGRLRRARPVRDGRPWRGGRPHAGRPGPAPHRLGDPPSRDLRPLRRRDRLRRPRVGRPSDARRPCDDRARVAGGAEARRVTGRLYVGTSGFAYPGWAPRFYPAGLKGDGLLRYYGSRLNACELNNTFYQQPKPEKVDAWLAATPPAFRFSVKAQRGGSFRSLAVDPAASVPWLTDPMRRFGERLGTILFRVPDGVRRDDDRLAALLSNWPRDLPLTMEFQGPSWHVD